MLLPAVVFAFLTAAPEEVPRREVAVVSVVWPGAIDDASADRLEELVRGSLARQGTPLVEASKARAVRAKVKQCAADLPCLAQVGAAMGASVLVRVEPAAISRDVAVLVQAIDTAASTALAEASVTAPLADLDAQLPRALESLASRVHARQAQVARASSVAAATSAESAPVAATPAGPKSGDVEVHEKAPVPSEGGTVRTAGLVAGGVGVLAVLGGGALFATAGTVQKDAHGNVFASQASQVAGIQQRQAAGLVVAGSGAALTIAGVVVFALTAPRAPVAVAPGPGGIVIGGRF